jgi:hypothetical protein
MVTINFIFGILQIILGIDYINRAYYFSDENAFNNGYFRKSNQYTVGFCLVILGLMVVLGKITIKIS